MPNLCLPTRRRAATVEAVVQLAATQNPSDITTSAIASHMHLTQGALSALPTKDAILQAVMEWVAEQLLARWSGRRRMQPRPWPRSKPCSGTPGSSPSTPACRA